MDFLVLGQDVQFESLNPFNCTFALESKYKPCEGLDLMYRRTC